MARIFVFSYNIKYMNLKILGDNMAKIQSVEPNIANLVIKDVVLYVRQKVNSTKSIIGKL